MPNFVDQSFAVEGRSGKQKKTMKVLKSDVMAKSGDNLQVPDKEHIKRVICLEECSSSNYLTIDMAVRIYQLYYIVHEGKVKPAPYCVPGIFEQDLEIAGSKLLVELKDNFEPKTSKKVSSSPTRVSAKVILKQFRLNPRLKLVYMVMQMGLPEKVIKHLIATDYPYLKAHKFDKSQCEKFISKVVHSVKRKSSHPLNSKSTLGQATKASVAFLFRCVNEPADLAAETVINILYDKPDILDSDLLKMEPTQPKSILSNRPKISKRTEALRRFLCDPGSLMSEVFQSNFLYPYISNPPIYGNDLLEILAHFRPNGKGLIDGAELKPFFAALAEFHDCGTIVGSSSVTSKKSFKKKIKICDLILALPLDEPLYEAFSLLFSPITGHFFMDLWRKYDFDNSGDMDGDEALIMIKDMLENSVANPNAYSTRRKSLSASLSLKLQGTACIIVQALFTCFGKDTISLQDLGHFLNIQQNFLNRHMLNTGVDSSRHEDLFKHYDQDCSGYVEGTEIEKLVRDIVVTVNGNDVDVEYEEVNVAKSLLLGDIQTETTTRMSQEDVEDLIPRRTACFTARANTICDAHDNCD